MGTLAGEAFLDGQMGCAQETLETILEYIHRESVCPNYLEAYCKAEDKFTFANKLDDAGCTPTCASHKSFGFQSMELTSCDKCKSVDEVYDVENKFSDPYYVTEIMSLAKSLPEPQ